MLKSLTEDHELNKNSFNMSKHKIMPNILVSEMLEHTIPDSPSSPPLSPTEHLLQTSSYATPSQISTVQNIQSTYQQQNHHTVPVSVLPCSTTAKRPSTEMYLNTTNSPDATTSNKHLMIKRFSEETGMNEQWSNK